MRVFSFPDDAGLRECLSQDWRGRARTLLTFLPCTDDATLWVHHFIDDEGFHNTNTLSVWDRFFEPKMKKLK